MQNSSPCHAETLRGFNGVFLLKTQSTGLTQNSRKEESTDQVISQLKVIPPPKECLRSTDPRMTQEEPVQ